MQETNRHRLDPGFGQLPNQARHMFVVEFDGLGTVGEGSFGNREAQVAWSERLRMLQVEVVEFVTVLPADLYGVTEPGCRNKSSASTLALDNGVRNESRPMNQVANRAGGIA